MGLFYAKNCDEEGRGKTFRERLAPGKSVSRTGFLCPFSSLLVPIYCLKSTKMWRNGIKKGADLEISPKILLMVSKKFFIVVRQKEYAQGMEA